jgi:hypothetical protein
LAISFWGLQSAEAAETILSASSNELPESLLSGRVVDNLLSSPPYGMEGVDVFYPRWFAGVWEVTSECTDIQAPCGTALFGGNKTYQTARADLGKILRYQSRFVSAENNSTIADREFNVKSIAKVAMGTNSVVDVSLATPNKFSCLLSPQGAPTLLTVDLLVLNRRQERVDEKHFDCAEVVREIVSTVETAGSKTSARGASRTATVLKEIETISLYTFESEDRISCRQRSATFLLPSQQDPVALKMWEASKGRPTDVRFYNVNYCRNKS